MAAGLLAGAIGGMGKAMQQTAQGQIEEKRKRALMELEQGMAMERQDDQQQFSRGERKAGQDFTSGENAADRDFRAGESAADREQRLSLAQMQEAGANSRAAAGRNDWELVPLEGGGYGRYNPRTNQFENANLPEGAQIGDDDISQRDKLRYGSLSDRAKTLREKQAEGIVPLTPEEKAQLGQLEAQMEGILGRGSQGGMTPLERLMAGEGGPQQGAATTGSDVPTGGDQPTVRGLLSQQMNERQNTQEANEARRAADQASDRADAVLERIDRELAGGAIPGRRMANINQARGRGGNVSQETLAEAQEVAEELLSLDNNPTLSGDKKRWIAERLLRLKDAGVPLNLKQ